MANDRVSRRKIIARIKRDILAGEPVPEGYTAEIHYETPPKVILRRVRVLRRRPLS